MDDTAFHCPPKLSNLSLDHTREARYSASASLHRRGALTGWGIKALVLRYGGIKLYRQTRPLFVGMIPGEFTIAMFWIAANVLLHMPVPGFPSWYAF